MSKETFAEVWVTLTDEHRAHLQTRWESRAAKEGIVWPTRATTPLVDYVWEIYRLVREARRKGP